MKLFDFLTEIELPKKVDNEREHMENLHKTGFWGKRGTGAIFLCDTTGRIGLSFRSRYVLEPHTFGSVGGAIDSGEDEIVALNREVAEEIYINISGMKHLKLDVFEVPTFKYTTYLVVSNKEFMPTKFDWESEGFEWFDLNNLPSNLHPGVAKSLAKNSVIEVIRSNIKRG